MTSADTPPGFFFLHIPNISIYPPDPWYATHLTFIAVVLLPKYYFTYFQSILFYIEILSLYMYARDGHNKSATRYSHQDMIPE
jgi:hypothetical protein